MSIVIGVTPSPVVQIAEGVSVTHYPRPETPTICQDKEAVEGQCTMCGQARLSRYPVLSEGGWFMVVRCANCLSCEERAAWRLLGHVELLSEQL
jgi:hypothetical protein